MRTNDIHGDLHAELEPGPLTAGPDGTIQLTQQARSIPPPPRLCAAGPCRHYHTFTIQLDAERALAGRVEQGGKLAGDAGPDPFYVRRHHYCYPTPGVETDLKDLPVLECSRWDPDTYEARGIDDRREAFFRTRNGMTFKRELADWRAARAAEHVPSAAKIERVVVVIGGHEFPVPVDADSTLRGVCAYAMSAAGFVGVHDRLLDSTGNEISNLDATLSELGVVDGEQFTLVRPVGHGG